MKKRWNIKQIEKTIVKMENCKISKLLNYSTVSKFVTKQKIGYKEMIYQAVNIPIAKI